MPILDTLLLLALPASGKSELRRFLLHAPPGRRAADYHVGETVQIDDFPYVHFMRVVDQQLELLGAGRRFYRGPDSGFADGRDWGTLAMLLGDDYAVIADPAAPMPSAAPEALFERIDRARHLLGAPEVFSALEPSLRTRLAEALREQARALVSGQLAQRPPRLQGRTIVIEFARGGPEGASMPLPAPHGYAWSLARLGPRILERAAVLYVQVSPEESRRKNLARARPGDGGSILHHSAPDEVMRRDYGCDDMAWLAGDSDRPGTIRVDTPAGVFHLPVAFLDNREDLTTFARQDPEAWDPRDAARLDAALREAMQRLYERSTRGRLPSPAPRG